VAVAFLAGCGPASDRPETVPVTGTVTLDNTPLDGALVTYSPTAAGGHAASGTTDGAGRFTLSTFESGDGALPGSYMVGFSKASGEAAAASAPADEEAAYKAMEEKGIDVTGPGTKEAPVEDKDPVPAKYRTPGTSGFKADITEAGPNDFNFPLVTAEE
jgi:hypothetical protein